VLGAGGGISCGRHRHSKHQPRHWLGCWLEGWHQTAQPSTLVATNCSTLCLFVFMGSQAVSCSWCLVRVGASWDCLHVVHLHLFTSNVTNSLEAPLLLSLLAPHW
jgi:hypothetical protein